MDEQPTVRKTFKFKLLPTGEQEQKMAFVLRRCCELYNADEPSAGGGEGPGNDVLGTVLAISQHDGGVTVSGDSIGSKNRSLTNPEMEGEVIPSAVVCQSSSAPGSGAQGGRDISR